MTREQAEARNQVLTVGGMLNRKLSKSEMACQADKLAQVAITLRKLAK